MVRLDILWQNVVDAFARARYEVRLCRQEKVFRLTATRNGQPWPMQRMIQEDEALAEFSAHLPADGDDLIVPLSLLAKVKSWMEGLPPDNWFEVSIAPDVADIKPLDVPPDFCVTYACSEYTGAVERRISHNADYLGRGCFLSSSGYWRVNGVDAQDDAWLSREVVQDPDILELVARRAPAWKERGLPFRCDLRFYNVHLYRQERAFHLTATRNGQPWPMQRMAAEDRTLGTLCSHLATQGSSLVIPLPLLAKVKSWLEALPADNWFEVTIAPNVAALKPTDAPPDFCVSYVWSECSRRVERRISHNAEYWGAGLFVGVAGYWRVKGVGAQDDAWLCREAVEGADILELVTQRAPAWQKRHLPFTCGLRLAGTPALTLKLSHVADDAVELLVDWRVDPASIYDVPSLSGYVVSDGLLMPGVSPAVLFDTVADQHATCHIVGPDIPAFLQQTWPRVKSFCVGPAEELQRKHKIVDAKLQLVLEIRSVPERGVGRPFGVPVLLSDGSRADPADLSRQMDAGARFVRLPSGWLPVEALVAAGVGPHGRATNRMQLDPKRLTPAEVILRGSERLDGPWDEVETPGLEWPARDSEDGGVRKHLAFLIKWGLPGGAVGSLDANGTALSDVVLDLLAREPSARVLAVVPRLRVTELGAAWTAAARSVLQGKASDPEPDPRAGGLVLATPKALEKMPGLGRCGWDLVCLLGADELVKSNRSKAFDALSGAKARLVLGLFSGSEWLNSSAKCEAMSAVFGLDAKAGASLVWKYSLLEPGGRAQPLPAAYPLRSQRQEQEPQAAELVIGAGRAEGTSAGMRSISVPRPDEYRVTFKINVQASGGTRAAAFIASAKELAGRRGKPAQFVPFHCYWPTYGDMSDAQRAWYFHWRGEVRHGQYPDTDLSYIFMHVYELLNDVGAKGPADSYKQLQALYGAYRDRYTKLSGYLVDWLSDYAAVNRLGGDPLEVYAHAAEAGVDLRDPDLALATYVRRPLREMPLVLVDQLTDYNIRKSKFYGAGYAEIVNEYMASALARVDGYMRAKAQLGIFEAFKPADAKVVRRHPFQGALYAGAAGEVTLGTVLPYTHHPPLREFLTGIVKYTENRLRDRYGVSGKLRGVAVGSAVAALIDALIPGQAQAARPSPHGRQVVIDRSLVDHLRTESDEVLASLLQDVDAAEEHARAEGTPAIRPMPPAPVRPAGTPDGLLTDLEPVNNVLSHLGPDERQVLIYLMTAGWEVDSRAMCAALAGTLTEPLVDRINALALETLGDFLIAQEDGRKVVAEDYRDELEYLLPKQTVLAQQAPDAGGLPPEWGEFRRELAASQVQALAAILRDPDPTPAIRSICMESGQMPEMLIDSINELANSILGDIVIDAGDARPTIEAGVRGSVEQLVRSGAA